MKKKNENLSFESDCRTMLESDADESELTLTMSWNNLQPKRLRRPNNRTRNRLKPQMLQMPIRLFNPRNLINMLQANRPRHLMPRLPRPLVYPRSLLQKVRGRRRFGDEGERAVGLDGDERWGGHAGFDVCCACVEFFAKVHGFDTSSTEGWADGGCGGCFSRGD